MLPSMTVYQANEARRRDFETTAAAERLAQRVGADEPRASRSVGTPRRLAGDIARGIETLRAALSAALHPAR